MQPIKTCFRLAALLALLSLASCHIAKVRVAGDDTLYTIKSVGKVPVSITAEERKKKEQEAEEAEPEEEDAPADP